MHARARRFNRAREDTGRVLVAKNRRRNRSVIAGVTRSHLTGRAPVETVRPKRSDLLLLLAYLAARLAGRAEVVVVLVSHEGEVAREFVINVDNGVLARLIYCPRSGKNGGV